MISGRPARRLTALAVAALSLLALAAVHGGGGGPALYDGLCTPPAYRLLGANPGPTSASATYSATDVAQTQELATTEPAPQAQMIIAAGSLTAPAGASVTVTITPVAAPAARPPGGSIDGNAYRFSARASTGQALDLATGHPATIVLAATSMGGPQLTLERFDGSAWTPLKTFQSGCGDTEEAASPSLGVFALVGQGSGAAPPAGGGGPPVAVIAVVVIVVLAAGTGAARLRRRRR